MRRRRYLRVLLVVVLMISGLFTAAGVAQAAVCSPVSWGSLPKVATADSPGASIGSVRAGVQPCYDRVVFDIGGTGPAYSLAPSGWNVEYGTPTAEGSGFPLFVPGGAKLAVGLAHPSSLGGSNTKLLNVTGFPVLRSVTYGGSFEGYSSFGIGVRARLPFRVFALTSPPRIVIDIARSWS